METFWTHHCPFRPAIDPDEIEGSRRKPAPGTCIVGLLVLVFSLTWTGCNAPGKIESVENQPQVGTNTIRFEKAAPQLASLKVEPAMVSPAVTIRVTGRLAWDDEVTVRVFSPVGGRVAESPILPGQPVHLGESLAKISSSDYGQAQSDVRKANADLILAERALNRNRDLLEHGAAARKDVDLAEDAYHNAKAEQERALSRLALYGGTSDSVDQLFRLNAPLTGIVVEKNINPGQEVRPDQMLANAPGLFAPLFVISDPTRLWLFLDVVENDIAGLRSGLRVRFQSRAYPGKTFEGVIDWIGDGLDPATRSVRARARVENPDRLLKAEMYVDAELTLSPNSALAGVDLPTKAVFYDFRDRRSYVFLETGEGQFMRQPVKIAQEKGSTVVISEGVRPGDRVVTSGCLLLDSVLQQNRPS